MRGDMQALTVKQKIARLPLGAAKVETPHAPLRHLRLGVVREHVRATAEGVVLRHTGSMAGEELPLGRPLPAVNLLAVRHPDWNAPVLLIRVAPGVPPQALAVGQVGVGER